MLSTSLLSDLPPDFICQVFEFADDFSVVAALAQTAHVFYDIWRDNPTSICRAVASRVISNLADAYRLLAMQEKAEAVSQSRDGREWNSIIRAKRLLSNARCASAASNDWVNLCQIHHWPIREEENPFMSPSEIARFEHAFYCVWTVGVMGTAPHFQNQASACLDACSPRELYRFEELSIWAMYYNENDFGSSGLDLRAEVWKVSCDLVSRRWADGHRIRAMPDYTPLNFFAFFDSTKRYLDMIPDE